MTAHKAIVAATFTLGVILGAALGVLHLSRAEDRPAKAGWTCAAMVNGQEICSRSDNSPAPVDE